MNKKPTRRNNTFSLNVSSIDELKKHKLSSIYKEVMKREDRSGLPTISINCGDDWIKGTIECSNLGYSFRGQTSTQRYPQINEDCPLNEMI